MTEYDGRWCSWQYKGQQCCGVPSVHVYPSNLERIQHGCGAWIATPERGPEGKCIVERGTVWN
jgi:hypothetical protein